MGETLDDAIVLIDGWLALTAERDLFSSDDCRDRLLDIRQELTAKILALT